MTVEYLDLLDDTLSHGVTRHGEKTEGTLSVTGRQIKFDFAEGFPLITVRDLSKSWGNIITREAPWILSGSTSAKDAEEKFGLGLWNRWAEDSHKKLGTPPGELGPVYGHQLRHWHGQTDQLKETVDLLKQTPETRRALISLWDIEDVGIGGVKKVNVANCITAIHFTRIDHQTPQGTFEERLDMSMTHRSSDLPAGAPHDWAVWGIVQMLVARELGIPPGTLTANIDDGQIYDIQVDKVKELLKRKPLPRPTVTINNSPSITIYNARPENFELHGYQHQERLYIPVAT